MNEQPLPLHVNGHMVDPASHVPIWNLSFELESFSWLSNRVAGRARQRHGSGKRRKRSSRVQTLS
jgi:hypothetical protein